MKRVIQKEDVDTVAVNRVDPSKYYGVRLLRSVDEYSGFISQEEYQSGNFRVMTASGITYGNNWDSFRDENLSILLSKLLNNGSFEIFEFDTYQELFQWISKK